MFMRVTVSDIYNLYQLSILISAGLPSCTTLYVLLMEFINGNNMLTNKKLLLFLGNILRIEQCHILFQGEECDLTPKQRKGDSS